MVDETNDLEGFIKQEQMVVLKRVTFSCYHDRMRGLLVLEKKHIARRRERILAGEELCAVVHVGGDRPYVFHLENGRRLEASIDDFYESMRRMSTQMCNKRVVVLLVARPRIFD